MQLSKLWLIIVIMSFSMLGSILLQVYWIRSAVNENEKRFKNLVHEALSKVAERLIEDEELELTKIQELSSTRQEQTFSFKLNKSFFSIDTLAILNSSTLNAQKAEALSIWRHMNKGQLADRLNPLKLDNLIAEEFENRGLDINYSYVVYDKNERSIILKDGHYTAYVRPDTANYSQGVKLDDHDLNLYKYTTNLFTSSYGSPGILLLHFPNEVTLFWKNIWKTVITSIFFTLLTLFCFAYAIYIIFRQKKLSEIKTDFINNMTHEFKTPIATISLASDSIKSQRIIGDADKVTRFANIIKEENTRMLNQVEKVLQVALLDKRDFQLKIVDTDIHKLIEKAASHVKLIVEKRHGSLTLHLDAAHTIIRADHNHVSNLIYNLLDNANKYSPDRPQITIKTKNTKNGIEIEVADKGIGMNNDVKKHIFDKFYRVHTGNRHDVKGFGLGLSYVKSIVEKHNGTVRVKSTLGQGSQFFVFLPFKQEK